MGTEIAALVMKALVALADSASELTLEERELLSHLDAIPNPNDRTEAVVYHV